MTTMEMIPEDVLVKIVSRLLARQVAQMRSISKYWKALLSQPSFIKSHLHRSIRTIDQVLLLFGRPRNSQPFTTIPPHTTDFIKVPVEIAKGMEVIGAVHGLICSSYDRHSVIHIWNPSLSAVLTLPPSSMPSFSYDYPNIETHLRFGFDAKTDDYKVVKLTGLTRRENRNEVGWWLPVEIYSMRKGSWELITERFPSHVTFFYNDDRVCVDGHNGLLHWLGFGEKVDSKTIVAFDIGKHTFREMPPPNKNWIGILDVLSGKLCAMSIDRNTDVIEVWVMEEYGVAESWAKHHVFLQIPQLTGYIVPCGFTSRGELLVAGNTYLVLYDPIEKKQKWVEDFSPESCGADNIVEYVDSLVWVTPPACPPSDGLLVDGGQISL